MKEVYQHPTVRTLAAGLGDGSARRRAGRWQPVAPARAGAGQHGVYVVCGALQLATFLPRVAAGLRGPSSWGALAGRHRGLATLYLRAVVFGAW